VPQIEADYPNMRVTAGGEQEEQGRFGPALAFNFVLALFAMYATMALAFGSYFRPLIVLLIVPLGFIGALLGHAALGLNLTLLSIFGVIGLVGVIVNDSLLIVDLIQRAEEEGKDPVEAISESTIRRVRAVTLTTFTTFFSIAPLILEASVQAQFLSPTAVALGFGVLFASVLQMFLVPALASLYAMTRAVIA
ncbi:MAG: efflux RND transporter permease subunit, partial [Sulfitobacter sp.]|nr:efflux RND transporter permease subunit [Sulfitobacter sp.]